MSFLPIQRVAASELHASAWLEANEWRGRCIDQFNGAERRISDLLIQAMHLPEYRGEKNLLPQLVGQKVKRLLELQEREGTLCYPPLKGRIEDFVQFHSLRGLLCHGEMKVALLSDGSWQIGLETLCHQDGRAVVRSLSLSRTRAFDLATSLQVCCKNLSSVMGQVRKSLAPLKAVPDAVPVSVPL